MIDETVSWVKLPLIQFRVSFLFCEYVSMNYTKINSEFFFLFLCYSINSLGKLQITMIKLRRGIISFSNITRTRFSSKLYLSSEVRSKFN